GFHVVRDLEQEAGYEVTALRLTCVEEGGSCWLEPSCHEFVYEVCGLFFVAAREVEGDGDYAVFVAFKVALAVEGLERVGGVVLVRSHECGEAELLVVGALVERLDEGEVVPVEEVLFVVVVLNEVVDL